MFRMSFRSKVNSLYFQHLMKLTITYSVKRMVTDFSEKNNLTRNIFVFIVFFGANVGNGLKNPPLFTFFSFQVHKIHDIIGGKRMEEEKMSLVNCAEKKRICVFGASSEKIEKDYIELSEKLGELLVRAGFGIVFGAGRTGLMGGAARGAERAGGEIIGVIPKKLNIPGIYFENCTERIETETMHERKALMEKLSCGFVALAGGFGTLEELMEVITLKQLGYHDLPIVVCNFNGFYDHLMAQFDRCFLDGFTDERFRGLYTVALTPEQVVEQLVNYSKVDLPDKAREILSHCENN